MSFGIALALREGKSVEAPAQAPVEAIEPHDQGTLEWTWHYRKTPRQVVDLVGQTERIVGIEIGRASPLLLDVATVHNVGRYERTSWWLPGLDPEPNGGVLGGYASRHTARIVALAPYVVGGETRFAALFLSNTTEGAGWWWYFDQSRDGVDSLLAKNDARPIDLRSYRRGGETLYAVVMVPKKGLLTWWYMGLTAEAVRARLTENGAALTSLHAADPAGATFDVIMDSSGMPTMPDFEGVSWVWGTNDTE